MTMRPYAIGLHAIVTWGLNFILFGGGFGFDPLIHLAHVQHLVLNGLSVPHAPLYYGQYLLVAGLRLVTRIPLELINQFLILPFAIISPFFVRHFVPGKMSWLAIFLIPIPFFTFTIPFHLSVFFLLLVLLSMEKDTHRARVFGLIAAGFALACHPIAGIPAGLLALASFFQRKPWISILTGILIATLLPLALLLGGKRYGEFIPSISWESFREGLRVLFGNPYPKTEPIWLWVFHGMLQVFPWMIAGFALWIKNGNPIRRMATVGIAVAALLSTFVHIPGIASSEQAEFSLRLAGLLPLFLLPDIARWIETFLLSSFSWTRPILLGLFASLSWYSMYTPFDTVAHAQAPNLSDSDAIAIQQIELQEQSSRFAIVSSPISAAYGLSLKGFTATVDGQPRSISRFAVDRQGILSKTFFQVLSDKSPQSIRELFSILPIDRVYFILPKYWDPDGSVAEALQKEAKDMTERGMNWVFEFE